MTFNFDRLTIQLSNSEEQLGNLSDVTLSTLFINPFESILVDLMSILTLDLIDDIDLNQKIPFKWIYVCVLVYFHLYFSIGLFK